MHFVVSGLQVKDNFDPFFRDNFCYDLFPVGFKEVRRCKRVRMIERISYALQNRPYLIQTNTSLGKRRNKAKLH